MYTHFAQSVEKVETLKNGTRVDDCENTERNASHKIYRAKQQTPKLAGLLLVIDRESNLCNHVSNINMPRDTPVPLAEWSTTKGGMKFSCGKGCDNCTSGQFAHHLSARAATFRATIYARA